MNLWGRLPRDSRTDRKPQRDDIFVESAMEMNSSSVRRGICRPDGAGDLVGLIFYKDFAPDGAMIRIECGVRQTVSGVEDADAANESVTVTVSSSGLTNRTVNVTVIDDEL